MESSDRDVIKTQVVELIAEFWGWSLDDLSEETDLYRDLNISGDDVDDLFLALSERFDLPLGEIDLRRCFPGEPHFFNPFPKLLFRPKRRIRVRHLIDAILLKRWPELDQL